MNNEIQCAKCKKGNLQNPLKCVNCENIFHNSCAKNKKCTFLNENSVICCENVDTPSNFPSSPEMDVSKLREKNFIHEISYLKLIIEQKDELIKELKEKNNLLYEKIEMKEAIINLTSTNKKLEENANNIKKPITQSTKNIAKQNIPAISIDTDNEGIRNKSNDKYSGNEIKANKTKSNNNTTETSKIINQNAASNNAHTENWEIVKDRKKINKPIQRIMGKSSNKESFKIEGLPKKSWWYISRVKGNVEEEHIIAHISGIIGKNDNITCQKIPIKGNNSSFKVGFNIEHKTIITDPEMWPEGILLSPYIFRKRASEDESKNKSQETTK